MSKLAQEIIKKIEEKKPFPKWRFIGLQAFRDVLLVILWLVAVLLAGALIYIISHYNPWENLPYGFRNLGHGFLSLPWELVILLFLVLILIYFVSRKVHFIYRFNPSLILLVIVSSLLGGYCIAESAGVNKNISQHPIAKEIYRQQGRLIMPNRGSVLVGEIKQIDSHKLLIIDQNNRVWIVAITKHTVFPTGQNFVLGGKIIIVGSIQHGIINSSAVRIIDANWRGSLNIRHSHNFNS